MRTSSRFGLYAALIATLISAAASAQTGEGLTLTPGFMPDPQRLAGMSGGPVHAQTINPTCRGWISAQPNHAINVQGGLPFLRIFVEAQNDTTLVIRAPNGQFMCADDTYGTNPGIDAAYGPGQYLVWIGSYSASTPGPYSIAFSELRGSRPANAGGGAPMMGGGGSYHGNLTVASGPGGAIFDNHTTTSTAVVAQSCVVANMSINIRGRHSFPSDLTVRLRSPTGQTEVLTSHQRRPFGRHQTRSFLGAPAAGTWELSVEDSVNADTGVLNGFFLQIRCM